MDFILCNDSTILKHCLEMKEYVCATFGLFKYHTLMEQKKSTKELLFGRFSETYSQTQVSHTNVFCCITKCLLHIPQLYI